MIKYLEKFNVSHRVAFVCGGAGLIGAEAVKALASAGAQVVILDINRKKGKKLASDIRKSGFDAHFEYFNSTKLEKIETNLARILKKYKKVHIWVDAAYPRTKDWGAKIASVKLKSLRENIDMQLSSCVWLSRYIALYMKKKKIKGSIINFGSIYGVQANDFNIYKKTKAQAPLAYSAIKAGIINLTRYIASCFGEYGIRANSICPGGIFDHQDKQFVKNYTEKTPLRRMGKPEDVASAVLFLASDASSYVSGSTMMVDGGWTIV